LIDHSRNFGNATTKGPDIKKYLGDMERRDGVRFGDIEREVTMSGYVMYKRVHENADIFENDDEHVGSAS
jgi:hypothetical protein